MIRPTLLIPFLLLADTDINSDILNLCKIRNLMSTYAGVKLDQIMSYMILLDSSYDKFNGLAGR